MQQGSRQRLARRLYRHWRRGVDRGAWFWIVALASLVAPWGGVLQGGG